MSTWTKVPTEPQLSLLQSVVPSSGDIEEGCEQISTLTMTKEMLAVLNIAQAKQKNKMNLILMGGTQALLASLGCSSETGLSLTKVVEMRKMFGENAFPSSPMDSYLALLIRALGDTTIVS